MSTQPNAFLTPEEYLAIERNAEFRSEYFNGQMYAMSGAGWPHNQLGMRLSILIGSHLDGTTCQAVATDMRVHIPQNGLYTYPDMAVVCGEPRFLDSGFDTLLNPILLVEILSPSTEDYDRGKKTKLYRDIPSLKEFLLISQDRHEVELYRRSAGGSWSLIDAKGPDASIELTSIGYTLQLSRLYAKILPDAGPA